MSEVVHTAIKKTMYIDIEKAKKNCSRKYAAFQHRLGIFFWQRNEKIMRSGLNAFFCAI